MDLNKLNETLNTYIRPQTFPVALKLLVDDSRLPTKVRRPVKDLGYQVALCQAIGLARRYHWTIAVGDQDQCCLGGAATMGFPVEAAKEGGMPGTAEKGLERGKYKYLLIAPLDQANFEADMAVIYCDPAQANRLVQAASFASGKEVPAFASGFMDCGDIVTRTKKLDSCLFILASGGDRAQGSTQDHEVIFTVPESKIAPLIKGLEDSQKIGFRYPVLTEIRHRPVLPPFLEIPGRA